MGSQVTRVMGFLPANFQLAAPFRSRLSVKHGTDRQTDRQTDTQRPSMHYAPNLWRQGHNNWSHSYLYLCAAVWLVLIANDEDRGVCL